MLATAATAQQLRVLRGMRKLKPNASEMDLRVWLNNHIREKEDQEFSRLQEKAWEPYMPGGADHLAQKSPSFSVSSSGRGGPVRQHSQPLFPGEYRANADDVQSISIQNLKTIYSSTAKARNMIASKHDLLLKIPSLDYEKLENLISNLFPNMEREETNALLAKVIESIQVQDKDVTAAKKYKVMTAEMLQLQGYPQTFTAMMDAVARRQSSKVHKVIKAREQFFEKLNFKWHHLQQLRKNTHLMGEKYTHSVSDVVDVVYDIYKDYIEWLDKQHDDAPDAKVPITERLVVDEEIQFSYATGKVGRAEAVVRLRENADGNGKMSVNGAVPISHFRGHVHAVEALLQPFDECDLNVFDFDVDCEVYNGNTIIQGAAVRMAISNALVKYLPHTKVYLNMAGFLHSGIRRGNNVKFTGERAPNNRYHWVKRGNPNKMFV
eukprot:TRINITY_DN16858_c0_g1_i1.p1 TRINITY_DN16858_c0_g1~~TRINITY_DN16858_c0_g1_i1.p1  ORF type:complete len:448 (+),score=177.36 TRINITY_DN16858_c0_g1_i1:39-1346(+)